MRRVVFVTASLLLAFAGLLAAQEPPRESAFRELEPGLEWAELEAPRPSTRGDGLVRVLRLDPQRFELVLLNASAREERRGLTPRGWAHEEGLLAVINAAMFQEDGLSSVSLMQRGGHINNPRLSKDRAILAFERKDESVPRVKLLDLDCEDWNAWKARYRTLVQSIRMISCDGRNVWSQQPRSHSTAAVAVDTEGRALFLHVASPYSTHDLIEMLIRMPLDIDRAMYMEGGAPAQLYVKAGGEEISLSGLPDSGASGMTISSPLPNVIGVRAR